MAVLIIGSSHVWRFEQFMRDHMDGDFKIRGCPNIAYHGISDGRISNKSHLDSFMQKIDRIQPQHLIVHIGGNDLDTQENLELQEVEVIIFRLLAFLTMCKNRYNIASVTVLQLCFRSCTGHVPVEIYNNLVTSANQLLKENLDGLTNICYWKLGGMQDGPFLDQHGVHFSPTGFRKYFRAIRGAIMFHA